MEKSAGHIAFDSSGREWFDVGGEVYVGQAANPISTYGYRLGRWECSRAHFDLFLPRLHTQWGLKLCYDCGKACATIELPDGQKVCASCAASYAWCSCGEPATQEVNGALRCEACSEGGEHGSA